MLYSLQPSQAAPANPMQGLDNGLNSISGTVTQGTMNVPWAGNSISYGQLQNIMTSNPGVSMFNIQFPNGTNWLVSPSQLQAVYNSYMQQARDIGYTITNPNLNFSSFSNVMNAIPVTNTTANMQMAVEPMLRELRYQQLHLGDDLPDWLKSAVVWVVNMLSQAWAWLMQVLNI